MYIIKIMDQDFQDLFDSDEEELFDIVYLRPNLVRPRINNFEKWSDEEFIRRFRLSKPVVQQLLNLIEHQLQHRPNRNNAITPLEQLLIALRFFATGSFYITIGDNTGIHKTTTGKIVERVCNAIIGIKDDYIYLPQNIEEMQRTQRRFYEIARFPRVMGALDCTHIKIQSVGGDDAENFRCRKGYFSINVQAICNASQIFTDIVSRWPGATHDSTIFSNSRVNMRFENNEFENGIILGDSGYPLKSYLITPLAEPQNEAEGLFNESQIRTRNIIERTFGVWKRFPTLSNGLRCKLPLIQKVIVATAVLHNIAILNNEGDIFQEEPANVLHLENNDNVVANEIDNNTRRELIDYFGTLS